MVSSAPAFRLENTPEVEKSPVKWCSVTLSDVISRGKRLEASVFDIEAKQAWQILSNGKYECVTLYGEDGIVKDAYYLGRFKRVYMDGFDGEAFYLPSQMNDIYPKPEKWISKITKCDFEDLRLKRNTLLLTRSGTIGNVSLVSRTLQGKIFSDDVIRITFKNTYDLGYVYTFLKSEIGNKILTTNGYGSVITHLEPEHLREIRVPDAPVSIKERIHQFIIRSYDLRDESNDLLEHANELMLRELSLPPIKNWMHNHSAVNAFSVKLSRLDGRADASYHLPLAGAIIEHLRKNAEEVTTIGDARISKDVVLPGRFKRVYVDKGYGRVFIGGKQLWELDPTNKKYLSIVHHGDRIAKQLELHENMTLITCSGTIGKVSLVGKQWENWTANQHIIRVIPANEEIAGYLNVFLSSDYGYQLITRFTYGSVVDEIDDNHVRQIAIPLLKDHAVQKRINDLALEANKKRYEAYCLEQEALRMMNEEVIFAK